ncbi:nucleotidyltransferase family protein [Halovibrio sp. HP20-50]|uniref:nucleotidyltransferase domain-containing protein n=1 Tax=Halovibrio sp. HP20-59 TaxID=3080275 RepID=UPI00294AC98B|nr:nucleotidyltransferase family protein [Halovibrio sp. HP20-59]MEA2120523.1 nucleotidyltransferase family protein [Halovibrio sp. HP20-59]
MMSEPPEQLMADPSFQLLLILSRLELNQEQIQAVEKLIPRVKDWDAFTRQASERFVLPIVHSHLSRRWKDQIPDACIDVMKRDSLHALQHNMNISAEFKYLVRHVLLPLNVPHLCFKGPSLAFQYYPEPAQRLCRDVDILVSQEDLPAILQYALTNGYKPHDPKALTPSNESVAFVARHQKVVTLLSPRNVAIELHTKIDNTGSVFKASHMLAKRQPITVCNVDTWVMPISELFVYLCWHHTKHYWSRLHWLVDITAIQHHRDFDLDAVLRCAKRYSLESTVHSCLEMIAFFASAGSQYSDTLTPNTQELVRQCVLAMHGDVEFEHSLGKKKPTPDFSFAWQTTTANIWWWRLFGWKRMFRPTYDTYVVWPLSPHWQWVYRFIHPFLEAYIRLAGKKVN